jgi:thiamine transport system ATP-binding protein
MADAAAPMVDAAAPMVDAAAPMVDAALRLEALTVRYAERIALESVDLVVRPGEIVALLGPSGSGKSSMLRAIAGLEPPAAGRVWFEGRDITAQPTHERGFGLMFQDFALFPHRDVGDNVAFGLRMRGRTAPLMAARVTEMLDLVGLPGAERRSVTQLSGGEQQRVALARALAPEPRLLMLDEPMGSLDRSLRERLPTELRAIFLRLGLTVLYVTHDQEEAFSVADRVVILRAGRVVADGTPEALWAAPPDAFTATFLGFRNVAPVSLVDGVATTPWGDVPLVGQPDGSGTLVLRPGSLSLAADGPIRGTVTSHRFKGDHALVSVETDAGASLELEVRDALPPEIGASVRIAVDATKVDLLPA